jgi:hypothetical protein
LAHAPYIHTCPTKHSHAIHKIDFRWPRRPGDQQSDFRLSFLVDDSVRTTGTKIDQPPAQPQQSPPPADKGIAIPAAVLR